MREHISGQYDAELDALRDHVMEMGGVVETVLRDAADALLHFDAELAELAIRQDVEVNRLELLIDEECNRLIARRQPTAGDLRLVMAILKAVPDLERIGDEAQRIAKMALEMSSMAHPQDPLTELREMIRLCREHLRAALDAFARVDADDAADIIGRDKHVDALYNIQIARLVALMEQEPTQVRPLLNIVWCARALERIGDHAKNVCEYVVYLSGGRDVRHRARSELGGGDVY